MKQVKYDGSRWVLITLNGGFFNPQKEVYFSTLLKSQAKIANLIKELGINVEIDKTYEIPDSGIYTSVCGPKCGPFWPNQGCGYCGGKGVAAVFDDSSGMQMGGTEMGNQEIEKVKNGTSSIEFPKG